VTDSKTVVEDLAAGGYVEVTTWSRSRRHLSDPKRKTIFRKAYRLTPLCQGVEADTEEGWTERYPQFWLAVKPFADLPRCKRCEKRAAL
jgi:hypothetical protein